MTSDDVTGFFDGWDPCWLAGPNAAEVAAAELVAPGDDAASGVVRRDHAQMRRRLGVPMSGRRVRVELVERADFGDEGFAIERRGAETRLVANAGRGLVRGFYRLLVTGLDEAPVGPSVPAMPVRMLNDWDNLSADEPMGSVERGYSGPSILFAGGRMVDDLSRLRDYARLLASIGINALALNNVNVHESATHLLTDQLDDVARAAAVLREYGVSTYLSVNFAAPVTLGHLDTADPLDERVREWWRQAVDRVYDSVPDFGGFVVKADSENRPGPFTYGRTHVDGANLLAHALAPHRGVVFWRAFVYDCHQDWRDRTTDRARAAADHFLPLDGRFAENVVLQVKYGPMDFQAREPVSPLLTRLHATNVAIELQVTQEYTGQQRHVCYLGELWEEVLGFRVGWDAAGGPTLAGTVARGPGHLSGLTAVSNVGADTFWTGHPLAQANLFAFGRLAWDPALSAAEILREWVDATFDASHAAREGLLHLMTGSWATYESYTAPLGVGFMVQPGHHYGPSVDGYEYSLWGTYHFADRDGVGVDRSVATGTGMAGLYPSELAERYEHLATCPDELLLFFHHVPYGHRLHSGSTVIQHIYDSHFAGYESVERMRGSWEAIRGEFPAELRSAVDERLAEQVRSAREWRDQVNTYFFRKSGVPDAAGRQIY